MAKERLIASSVIFCLILMDRPINLNHQARQITIEINNKPSDHLLPTKLPAIKTSSTEPFPEQLLGVGRITT
ncbi:MAG: hypothetical protein Fur005_21770 [Roseiflexaceae bacterium]